MSDHFWIAHLFGRTPRTSRSRSPRRPLRPLGNSCRLGLEGLEDRLAPATLTVNNNADTANPTDPYLSLRQAIAIVNSPTLPNGLSAQILAQISGPLHAGGMDSIVFDPSAVTTPITLARTQLELSLPSSTATITIDGGAAAVTVDANHASRIFRVDSGVGATLDHLTLTNGRATGSIAPSDGGGGISNAGTLTVADSTLLTNSADFGGGGIVNEGRLTVDNSTFSLNSTPAFGGGIDNEHGTVTVSNTTFVANESTSDGGAIDNEDRMTVTDSFFEFNSSGFAGGIFNGSTLTVTGSTLESNTAADGGGIFNSGPLTVSNSSLTANVASEFYGGGIDNEDVATVSNSTFLGNTANSGGGISNAYTMTVMNCTFRSNSAIPLAGDGNTGGGIYNGGTLTMADSTVESNSAALGGGIDNENPLTVTGSTFTANLATDSGGGLFNGDRLTMTNCTVSSNSATHGDGTQGDGGGIDNTFTATLVNSTVSSNSASNGGGLFNASSFGTALHLQNTIVAGNYTSAANHGPDVNGVVASASSYNLIGVGDSTLSGISHDVDHNQIGTTTRPIDPRLTPLGYYGGPTRTVALLPGSPAHLAGSADLASTSDQRGLPTVFVAGMVDLGAFQTQSNPFLVTTIVDPGQLSGQLSLREAVNLTNVLPGTNTVSFDTTFNYGTVNLTAGQLELSGTGGVQTIDGSNRITLSANYNSRLVQIDAGTQAALRNLSLGYGYADNGGAVLNQGTLTLADSTLFANVASNGGAVSNQGTLTLYDSTLEFNSANLGGGLYNAGQLTSFNSTFVYNTAGTGGGALYNAAMGNATLTSLSISLNFANTGGGLDVAVSSVVLLRNSIVAGNFTADTSTASDIAGTVAASSSYNLIGTGGSGGLSDGSQHNLVGVANPGLTEPDFNTTLSPVFGFQSGSPALGAGDPSLLSDPDLRLDQHGNVRTTVNIGAV